MTATIRAEMPIERDLRMKHGADFRMTIFAKEDDRTTIKDTTDWEITMTLKERSNGRIYATLSNGAGITNTPAEGKIYFELPADTVDGYPFTRCYYDIIITDAGGDKTCPFYGTVEMLP